MSKHKLSNKTIILSLAFTHLGAVAQSIDTNDTAPPQPQDLLGLVATDESTDALFSLQSEGGGNVSGTDCFQGGVDSSGIPILPDLSIALDADVPDDPALVNQIVNTSLLVTNSGRDCAPDTVINIDLSPNLELLSTSGCLEDPVGVPVCTLDDVIEETALTVEAQFRIAGPQNISSIDMSAVTVVPEENDGNNQSQFRFNVLGAVVPAFTELGKWLLIIMTAGLGLFGWRKSTHHNGKTDANG